jgi:hypothetical protein
MEELVRIGAAAKTIGVSVDTLRRWERDGRIQFVTTISVTCRQRLWLTCCVAGRPTVVQALAIVSSDR